MVYLDGLVVCNPHFVDKTQDTLLNPVVLFEVLSDSTEIYDCNTKLVRYQQIPSLMAHLMVSQKKYEVTCHIKQNAEEWLYRVVTDPEAPVRTR